MTRSFVVAVGLALALLLVIPGPTVSGTHGTAIPRSTGPGVPSTREAALAPSGTSAPLPIGGRLFAASTTPPEGDTETVNGLAVDPAIGAVFAANQFADTVTEFNESTGTLLNAVSVTSYSQGNELTGLALDAVHHRLFVSVLNSQAGSRPPGWVEIVNETNFALLTKVSPVGAPHAPFEPTFLSYDAPSDQLFVENQTGGDLAIVNLSGAPPTIGYLDCPVTNCAYRGYGLLDVPSYHTLVVPTCALQIWFVNTSNDSTRATVSGPPGSLMAWAAFDAATQALWVENYSFGGPNGSFLRMNLTTLTIQANVPGAPPRGTQLVYDSVDDLLVGTDLSGPEHISTYDASNATAVASYQLGSGSGSPFLLLVVDPLTRTAIAAGPGYNGTVAFRLPSLAVALVYSSFPASQPAAAVDPSTGTYFVGSQGPNGIRAASESTGALRWSTPLPTFYAPLTLVVDPSSGSLFVASPYSTSVEVLNTSTGAVTGAIPMPGGSDACGIVDDPAAAAVYVSTTTGLLLQVDPSTETVVRTFTPSPLAGCSLALDPATGDVLFVSDSPGAVSVLVPSIFAVAKTWYIAGAPGSILVNDSGVAFVLDQSGSGLTLWNGSTGAALGALTFPGGLIGGDVGDSADAFVFAASTSSPNVTVVATSGPSVAGVLPLPELPQSVAFDPVSGTLVVPLSNGELTTEQLVPVPSGPLSLTATPGNGTLRLNWSAPMSSGPDPVDGYVVQLHPGPGSTGGQRTNVTASGLTVPGLTDGVPYSVRVVAHSAAGLGLVAATVAGTPIGLPYPPTALQVNVTGPTTLAVHWSPPVSDDGANVSDYWVYAFPAGGTAATSISAGLSLSVNVTGLQAGTSYLVYVTAINAAGTSPPSASMTVATLPAHGTAFPWAYLGVGIVAVAVGATSLVIIVRRRRDARRPPRSPTVKDAPA